MISWVLKFWMGLLDIRFSLHSPAVNPGRRDERLIFALWHEGLLIPATTHVPEGLAVMVSTHRDGELMAQVIRMLGGCTARGSSTRGGAAATLGMLRASRASHLVITPDGPRGPRRKAQRGALFIASRGQLPLVPAGVAADRCWRVRSWDRMLIPKPGAKAYIVLGEALHPPAEMNAEAVAEYMDRFQRAMDAVQETAERLAAGEKVNVPLVHWTRATATRWSS